MISAAFFQNLQAQETKPPLSAEELARKHSNPVASLISGPFQNNIDVGIRPYNGSKNTLNFQPVIPISMTANFNLIARFILPIVSQHDITGEGKVRVDYLMLLSVLGFNRQRQRMV